MGRAVDAEYAWWMDQLQNAVDEEIRLQASATPEQIEAVRDQIAIIRFRIEDLLHREMERVGKSQ